MVVEESVGEDEMVGLPEAWKTFEDGTPVPNWVALLNAVTRKSAQANPDTLKLNPTRRRSRSNGVSGSEAASA